MKPLNKIRHGEKVLQCMPTGKLFFVEDIRRASGLDDRSLRQVLNRLLKNNYIQKNNKGQWSLKEPEEMVATCGD